MVTERGADPTAVMASLSDEDVERALLDLERHLSATNAWFHAAVGEFSRREIAQREYVLSPRQWLRRFCRMSANQAARIIRTATHLRHMPEVHKHAMAGDIGPEALAQIASARHRHPDDFALHEPVFAEIATYLTPSDLRVAIRHWSQQVELGSPDIPAERRRDKRRVSMSQTFEGMWHVEGLLDAESGHVVSTALRAIADPGNIDTDDSRTHPQRMADAVVDVSRFWLDHNESALTSAGEKPHITVTVSYEHLTRSRSDLPEIDGVPVTAETIRRLACDAGIVRMIIDGESQPLDVGRRMRTVTPAIRRALEQRDGGCRWFGCDAPMSWCDAHHVVHWADGGVTSVDNMMLLCRSHHTATHDGRRPRRRLLSDEPPDP